MDKYPHNGDVPWGLKKGKICSMSFEHLQLQPYGIFQFYILGIGAKYLQSGTIQQVTPTPVINKAKLRGSGEERLGAVGELTDEETPPSNIIPSLLRAGGNVLRVGSGSS